jgi:Transposase and inactivated derivatives
MRHTRIKLPAPASYHVTSRVKNDDFFIEDDADKRDLLGIIRRAAEFAGVIVMSYTILDNHFHLLVQIPVRKEVDDAELERRVRILWGDEKTDERLARWRFWEKQGKAQLAEKERNAFRRRMYDLTPFVKTIKEQYTHSYHKRHNTCGTVWGRTRFKSAAVAPDLRTLSTVAAYIDLNAVRARIARHPKNYKWCGLGAAKKGDTLALFGLAAIARVANCGGMRSQDDVGSQLAAALKAEDYVVALNEYMQFLDGTKDIVKTGLVKGNYMPKKSGDTLVFNGAATRPGCVGGGYVRKTLDSADLSRLGAEGVARWLAESEIQPESLSEMWRRRFGNFAVGGILGPLALVLESREAIATGAGMRFSRPGMFEGVCSFIQERNFKARKRNAV